MTASEDKQYLLELNEAQRAAVEYNEGPALVLAGAGSGKTRVLVYKLLHLLHCGYKPSKLMALTFTNKAAREMRGRIEALVGQGARQIHMGTFHSIFSRILRSHAELLGYTPNFTIYNSNDSKNRIKHIIKTLALDDKNYKPNLIASRISRAKNHLQSPEMYRANTEQSKLDTKANIPRTGEIYARYTQELKLANAMDFDDLLMQTNILFRQHPEVLALWQERLDYLLIDEYQDTNFAQYMIARQLMQDKGKIFVVGDDAQSIYSFRGANIKNILDFQNTFKRAKLFKLEQNYRSTRTIVEAARRVIAHNHEQIPKEVFSLGEKGEPITLYEAISGEAEAIWVAHSIQEDRQRRGGEYSDYAILYRTNQQSRILEQKLRGLNIPFKIWGGHSFFSYKEIMDVMAYFRLMVNEVDDEALLRIINYPKRGIGDSTILKLREQALQHGTSLNTVLHDPIGYGVSINKGTQKKLEDFCTLLDQMRERCKREEDFYTLAEWLINTSGIPKDLLLDSSPEGKGRRDNIQELLVSLDEYARNATEAGDSPTLANYLGEIALLTDQDTDSDEERACVTLMTIHASKGLEFSQVFIVGLEEQLFPSAMCVEARELEEERRLFYVAITRAEKVCSISHARERYRNGKLEFVRPSRFLRELPRELLRTTTSSVANFFDQHYGGGRNQGTLPQSFSPGGFMPREQAQPKRQVHIARREGAGLDEPRHQSIEGLREGGRVEHPKFGCGEVLRLEGNEGQVKATIRFDSGEEKKLLLRFANLKVLD